MIIKEKRPQSIWINRNSDGTYEVLYQGMTSIDENNNIKPLDISIPRCSIDWDDNGFLPQAKVGEIFKNNDNDTLIKMYIEE